MPGSVIGFSLIPRMMRPVTSREIPMNALLDPTRSFGRLVLRAEDLLVQGGGQAAVLVAVGLSFGLALFELAA